MSEQLEDLKPEQFQELDVSLVGFRETLKETLPGYNGGKISSENLAKAWVSLIRYPIPPDLVEWLARSFGVALGAAISNELEFRWKILIDEYGKSLCLVEPKTGIRVFPMDTVQRNIEEQRSEFIPAYFANLKRIVDEQAKGSA